MRGSRGQSERTWAGGHSLMCWTEHPGCALRAAESFSQARIAHEAARLSTYRRAKLPGASQGEIDLAVEVARAALAANHEADWSAREAV